MIRFRRSTVFALTLLLALPGAAPAADRGPGALPALVGLELETVGGIGGGTVIAHTGPDSSGRAMTVSFDPRNGKWTRPARGPISPPAAGRLDQVLVFEGGLFDQFPGRTTIELGQGFVLAKHDSGYALLENNEDRGWPVVTENEAERWGREVRLGLPSEFPEARLMQLLSTGRLRNVPGPVVVTEDALWFGLAGGFTGGDGQLGGVVSYDRKGRTFRVHRHKFMVDASVTRLLVIDDTVWIGTGRFGPTQLEGLRGLVLYRPKRAEWRQFAPDNSRISGDLIYDLAGDARMLWATTDQGVSRYDTTRRLWTSWYWHPLGDEGDFELTDQLPGDVAEELAR